MQTKVSIQYPFYLLYALQISAVTAEKVLLGILTLMESLTPPLITFHGVYGVLKCGQSQSTAIGPIKF